MIVDLPTAVAATLLSVAGLGFALVLAACMGWEVVSRETNRRNPNAG